MEGAAILKSEAGGAEVGDGEVACDFKMTGVNGEVACAGGELTEREVGRIDFAALIDECVGGGGAADGECGDGEGGCGRGGGDVWLNAIGSGGNDREALDGEGAGAAIELADDGGFDGDRCAGIQSKEAVALSADDEGIIADGEGGTGILEGDRAGGTGELSDGEGGGGEGTVVADAGEGGGVDANGEVSVDGESAAVGEEVTVGTLVAAEDDIAGDVDGGVAGGNDGTVAAEDADLKVAGVGPCGVVADKALIIGIVGFADESALGFKLGFVGNCECALSLEADCDLARDDDAGFRIGDEEVACAFGIRGGEEDVFGGDFSTVGDDDFADAGDADVQITVDFPFRGRFGGGARAIDVDATVAAGLIPKKGDTAGDGSAANDIDVSDACGSDGDIIGDGPVRVRVGEVDIILFGISADEALIALQRAAAGDDKMADAEIADGGEVGCDDGAAVDGKGADGGGGGISGAAAESPTMIWAVVIFPSGKTVTFPVPSLPMVI